MPQVQVVDTTENQPEPTGLENFFSKLGKSYKDDSDRVQIGSLIKDYKQNREDANAWEDLQLGLETSTISPTKRLETQRNLNEMKKVITERDKAMNTRVNKGILTEEEKQRQKGNLIKAGWPEYAADVYLDAPAGVKGTLEREHEYLTRHGIRKPLVQVPKGLNESVQAPNESTDTPEKPVFVDDPESSKEIKDAKKPVPVPEDEWPEIEPPENTPPDEIVKWKNNNEKENNKEIKETNDKKKGFRSNDHLISNMIKINDGKYLPTGVGKFITIDPETGDIREVANIGEIANAQTQLYIKELKRWQKGAKEFYGSRVTNFDLQSFMQQLPTLLNSEQGRRLILKEMKYTNELESVYNNTMNEALKKYGRNANFGQISKVVDEKIKDKEAELIGKIDNLVEASDFINIMGSNPEKFKNITLMQNTKGEFKYVPNDKVKYLKTEKKWRDF